MALKQRFRLKLDANPLLGQLLTGAFDGQKQNHLGQRFVAGLVLKLRSMLRWQLAVQELGLKRPFKSMRGVARYSPA